MITLLNIQKKAQINAGSFIVSIGTHKETEVALFSKHSGEFVSLRTVKKSKRLRAVKRNFKTWLNSDQTFTFSHLTPERTVELIKLLKK